MHIGESLPYRISTSMEVLWDNGKVPRVVWLQSKLTTAFGVQVSNTEIQYICETSLKTWKGHLCVKLDILMDI
jgi:hypothetical protein